MLEPNQAYTWLDNGAHRIAHAVFVDGEIVQDSKSCFNSGDCLSGWIQVFLFHDRNTLDGFYWRRECDVHKYPVEPIPQP